MTPGVIVLVVAVLGALGFGAWRAVTDGRFRGTRALRRGPDGGAVVAEGAELPSAAAESVLSGTAWETGLGERATLLQFSSAFCAPCRATRTTLAEVARIVPGVVHIEVDAELHLDLVRRAGVMRTPTTIVLDASGREQSRAAGAPTQQAVIAGLGRSA